MLTRALLCTNGANRLSGESDNDVESVNSDKFFGCLFNQSEPKKDAAAKRIKGFLSAVPAKKIDDNFFADAALKKLFVQYNTSLPSSAAVERLFSSAGLRKFKLFRNPKFRKIALGGPQSQICKFAVRFGNFLRFRNRK